MASGLKVSIGQHSGKGRKKINQDFHSAHRPNPLPLLAPPSTAAWAGVDLMGLRRLFSARAH
ncbi:serine/threonine protein kinase [Stigmatella aurantiaca DW4/3-1]|uniref:Serine/threonine protein kinase n=1 Tax=Stigmatella aurantiaca (strain DW4/3-1) TaxID=378806 RepID=E3FK78_STIAD|nr:serine/threonine protein kinase [Stigmatella aurantiaca DW4/3-1]